MPKPISAQLMQSIIKLKQEQAPTNGQFEAPDCSQMIAQIGHQGLPD